MHLSLKYSRGIALFVSIIIANTSWATDVLTCTRTISAPQIDGIISEDEWRDSTRITIDDARAPIEHKIACAYDNNRIYISAQYSDKTESRSHKTGVWDEEAGLYNYDVDREDTLILKWNMDDNRGDLSITSDKAYKADVWYWKAFRTDPAGYADDKSHTYSKQAIKKASKQLSKRGNRFFLARRGDKGKSAYKPIIHLQNIGLDSVASYEHRTPEGSRADVRAKGKWLEGIWTIEFSRALDTGHPDDIRFKTNRRYQVGISRYEIAGQNIVAGSNNPLHGSGDIDQTFTLVFDEALAEQQ